MAEVFDVYLVRLLDILEQHPDFHYLLEQAVHYRDLKKRRPDLFAKIKRYVQAGNLEFATGLASTIENNVTNGESFVRNMQLGTAWLQAEMEVVVESCMMIDTFGFPPQMPQLINQFGFQHLFANRVGGDKIDDVYLAEGLDGSSLLMAGRQAGPIRKEHFLFEFYKDRQPIDKLFQKSVNHPDDPIMIMPYSENEVPPDTWIIEQMKQYGDRYQYGTLKQFFQRLDAQEEQWPRLSADLNPEFTGTYSLRQKLRLVNREVEQWLLDAEKLCALRGERSFKEILEEGWWEMAYTQFHDIITGSHPTAVYQDCLQRFQQVKAACVAVMEQVLAAGQVEPSDQERVYTIWNSLPWTRKEAVALALPQDWPGVEAVLHEGASLPFQVREGQLKVLLEIAPVSTAVITLRRGEGTASSGSAPIQRLENDHLLIELGQDVMIKRIYHKPSGRTLLENSNDILILQEDRGNFQIEDPRHSEVRCGAGEFTTELLQGFHAQQAVIRGTFPVVQGNQVAYVLTLTLPQDKSYLEIQVDVDWRAEAARLRLHLPSTLGATENDYEVPFGVARRAPYRERDTAKGEWAAHRFVVMENEGQGAGLALANNGVAGVEMANGTLKTTLLRAPHSPFAGMIPDDTSSDHGQHRFHFRLLGYQGSWKDSGVIQSAQELNAPYRVFADTSVGMDAAMRLAAGHVVLSAVKEAGEGFTAVRLYETAGVAEDIHLEMTGLVEAWESDVKEKPGDPIACQGSGIALSMNPYEIKTILIKRK